jgi:hypothetical protein
MLEPTYGTMQRSTHAARCAHIGTVCQKEINHFNVAMFCPAVQGHQPLFFTVNSINIGAELNE